MMSDGKGTMMPVKQSEDADDVATVVTSEKDNNSPGVAFEAEPVTIEIMKGEVQPPAFRDGFFAILFFVQVAAVAGTAIAFGPAWMGNQKESDNDENQDNNINNNNLDSQGSSSSSWTYTDTIFFLVGTFLAATVVTMSAFRVMIRYPLTVIQVSFFLAPVSFAFVALLVLANSKPTQEDPNGDVHDSKPTQEDPNGDVHDSIVGVFWGIAAVFSLYSLSFYYCYKRFMPFAAVNLKVALIAVRANMGLFGLSVGSVFAIYA